MVDKATFMGDVTGLGIKVAGVKGVVIDGGLRDLNEFLPMKDLPVFYKGAHASAMADQVGVEWNGPIRIGTISVLPGDVVIADASGVLTFPPQLAADVIKDAEGVVHVENFKREMMRTQEVPDARHLSEAESGARKALRRVVEDTPEGRRHTEVRTRSTPNSQLQAQLPKPRALECVWYWELIASAVPETSARVPWPCSLVTAIVP